MTKRTTVGLSDEVKNRLNEFKFENRCRSFNEAVDKLLEQSDVDASQ